MMKEWFVTHDNRKGVLYIIIIIIIIIIIYKNNNNNNNNDNNNNNNNNNNKNNNNNNLYTGSSLPKEWYSVRPCKSIEKNRWS